MAGTNKYLMLSDHLQTLSHKKKEKQGPMKKMNLVEMYFNDYMLAYRCCYISISNRNSKQPKNSLKNSSRILIIDFYYSRSKSYIDMSFQYMYFNFVQFRLVHLRYRKIACQIILINKTIFSFLRRGISLRS